MAGSSPTSQRGIWSGRWSWVAFCGYRASSAWSGWCILRYVPSWALRHRLETTLWPTAPRAWIRRRRGWLWRPRSVRPSATRPSKIAASSAWLWTAPGRGALPKNRARCVSPSKTPRAGCTVRLHHFVLISVVGAGLTLPVDVEPYGPGDSEYAAGQRLLRRAVDHLGPRFADYVVGDAAYATAPFLHSAAAVGLPVVARVKENLPLLAAAVRARFDGQPPHAVFQEGDDRVEVWDADDFDPWETLDWPTVRVLRYRQHKPDGTVIQAEWLTDFSIAKLGSLSFYRIAKSR